MSINLAALKTSARSRTVSSIFNSLAEMSFISNSHGRNKKALLKLDENTENKNVWVTDDIDLPYFRSMTRFET